MSDSDIITPEFVRSILDYDPEAGEFISRKSGARVGWVDHRGYRRIKIGSRKYRAHRLAWFVTHGEWPSDQIDHINRDKLDNRIENLRVVNNSENMRNLPPPAIDPRTLGVTFHKRDQRYVTSIRVAGRTISLGSFKTFDEARAARVAAEIKHFGQPSPIDYRKLRRAR